MTVEFRTRTKDMLCIPDVLKITVLPLNGFKFLCLDIYNEDYRYFRIDTIDLCTLSIK